MTDQINAKKKQNGTPNRYLFLLYNIIHGVFCTLIIPYTPAFLIGGLFPSQLLWYDIALAIASVVWGYHLHVFLQTQPGK